MAALQPSSRPEWLQPGIEFAIIEGHERYGVGSDGSVWARNARTRKSRIHAWDRWHRLTPWCHRSGHFYVKFGVKGYQVHRLVLQAFGRNNRPGEECRHLDGNPANNRLENLQWGTRGENIADKARHETGNQGERHPLAKLTNSTAGLCRELYARHGGRRRNGVVSFVSRWFGVSTSQASLVVRGKSYV